MFATRRVLASAASAASTTQSGALLKPRTQLETITAAFKTLHGFIFDDKTRHSFVDAVNKGVINPYILGQADMGFFVTLALHHNLNSEPLSKYKNQFQAEEFLEGSEAALESFQETLYSLDKKVLKDVQEEWIKIQKLEERVDTNDTQSSMVEKGANDKETDHQKDHMDEIFKKANMSLEKIELLEQAISAHGDWKAMAEEDPDSLYGQFYNMVSDPLLEACKNQFMQSVKHCFLLKIPRMDYELESGKIQDIALLSARAHEVIPEEDNEEEPKVSEMEVSDKAMTDDSLSNGFEKSYPVAAQIEVIYNITQRFRRRIISPGNVSMNISSDAGKSDEEVNTVSDVEEPEELQTAWVAVFEGLLHDGQKGETPLRWKLVDNRPALEFRTF
jgi:hypothetical protein